MKRGFTLIEVLIVVMILGILATLALPQFQKAVMRSRLAEAWVNLGSIRTGEALYYMEWNSYTTSMSKLDYTAPTGSAFNYTIRTGTSTLLNVVAKGNTAGKTVGIEAWVSQNANGYKLP